MLKIFKSRTAKSLKQKRPAPYDREFTDEALETLENEFIDNYVKSEVKPFRMLLKIYCHFWRELLLAMLLYLIKHSPTIYLPIVTADIINFVAYPATRNPDALILRVALLLFLLILNVPTHMLYTKYYSRVTRRVEAGLRGAMVRKLQQLSIPFHKEMQSGRIQSKLMRDVETVHSLSFQLLNFIPQILISVVTALIVVLSMNLTVFLFFILCVPLTAVTSRFFRSRMARYNKDYRVSMEATSAKLMDMVEMTEITRAHALEDKEIKSLTARLKNVANAGVRVDVIQSLFGASMWVAFQSFQLACLLFTSYLAWQGIIQVGDISLYQSYYGTLTGQVSAFLSLLPTIARGLDSISSIGEILSATDVEDNTGKKPVPTLRGEYQFKNVTFSYDKDQELLKDFSLHVRPGETIAFVGESGCGKTTTMNLVLGFNLTTGGEILVDGRNIKDIDLHSYRSHIAIVPQTGVLFTGTIRENITYGIDNISDEELAAVLDAARLTEFIASLPDGLDTMLNEHGSNLSGGQRQRLSIARAIIRKPAVIIFDEATSALDSVSEREIQKAIDNLSKNHTTFVVAHRLSTVKNADRIVVLRNGRCEEIGSYEELMAKKGFFYQLQTAQ